MALPFLVITLGNDEYPAEEIGHAYYPDRIYPKRALSTQSQQFFRVNISPIPNAPAPSKSWQQTFPAFVPGRSLSQGVTATIVQPLPATALLGPLSWLGNTSMLAPVRRVRISIPPFSPPFQNGGIIVVPTTGGVSWRPIYPNPPIFPPVWFGMSPGPIITDPAVIMDGAPCTNWSQETLVNPSMAAEVIAVSGMSGETLTNPSMAGEVLC